METRCKSCKKPFWNESGLREFCNATCRKRYHRGQERLTAAYNNIMREMSALRRLAKSHPHLRPEIASTLRTIQPEIPFLLLLADDVDERARNEMLTLRGAQATRKG